VVRVSLVTGAAGALAAAAVLVAVPTAPRARPAMPADGRPPRERLEHRVQRWARHHLPSRGRRRRDRQLPDALARIASALRAGESVGTALAGVAASTSLPLGAELDGIARSVALGRPVASALRSWASEPGASDDVRLVATALAIGSGTGGELARAVDGVATTLRERHELRREVEALATQARASAVVLAVAPLGFTALVATVEPAAAAFLVTRPAGLVCLVLGLSLEGAGAVWMARITRGAA
jgi:tight adherence protein B